MSQQNAANHPVARQRAQKGWSQAELAQHADIPRTTISAIEGKRLTPSVAAALALGRALECSVEELFGRAASPATASGPQWAWTPRSEPCRYWEAEVGGRRWLYPVESLSSNIVPHDGVWRNDLGPAASQNVTEQTLVLSSCDPAAGLLAAEYARTSGFRLIVLTRGGGEAIGLLKRGLVHVAGLHRSTPDHQRRNEETVQQQLGSGFHLVRAVQWQEGLALAAGNRTRSPKMVGRSAHRWALREAGSAARECLDELLGSRRVAGREVKGHLAVAEAVYAGWADAGVCVQFSAEAAGLHFLPMRTEALDFCFSTGSLHDPRIQALIRLLRSRNYRQLVSELPGYDARETGEILAL